MLNLAGLITIVVLVIGYAIYCIIWICWYFKFENVSGSIADVENTLFYGGPQKVRNVLLIGIATYHLFTPCLTVEFLVSSGLSVLTIYISRVFALIICTIIWNQIASMGFRTLDEYLQKRYDSKLILIIYRINQFIGLLYIWSVQMNIIHEHHLFHIKSNVIFLYLMIFLFTFSVLGGIHAILIACLLMWIFESIGQCLLIHQSSDYLLNSSHLLNFKPDTCYSILGPNCFLIIIGYLLTVQPGYVLFQTANSITEANIAMSISIVLLTLNTFLTGFGINGAEVNREMNNLSVHTSIHALFNLQYDKAGEFIHLRTLNSASILFETKHINIDFKHFLILLGLLMSNTIACFLLQMHSMSISFYQNVMPNWLRIGLITDGRELHVCYSCLSVMCAYLSMTLLIYSSTKPIALNFTSHHLFRPSTASILLMPVTSFTLFGAFIVDLWSIPVLLITLSVSLIGLVYSVKFENQITFDCLSTWFPSVIFFSSVICTIILSAILKSPRYSAQSFVFRYNVRFRRKTDHSRSLSIITGHTSQRFTRTSFRMGTG